MRLLLIFIIFILGVFYTFGENNEECCEQCCEYLKNCCNKGKVKVENLVNENWLNKKKQNINFILNIFNKNENENENEYKSGDITIKLEGENENTKIANLEEVGKKLKNNTQKWALFEIIYKEEKEEGEERKTVYLYCSDIESIGAYGIFDSCKQHISISVIACNTSGVTDMFFMFSGCSSLTKLDLFNFNTEKVTNMFCMFASCEKLKNLDLSKFDFKNVTDTSGMFSGIPDENLNSFTLPESLSKINK